MASVTLRLEESELDIIIYRWFGAHSNFDNVTKEDENLIKRLKLYKKSLKILKGV